MPSDESFKWSTEKIPDSQQFSFWREAVCEAFLNLEVESENKEKFQGAIDSTYAGLIRHNVVEAQQQVIKLNSLGLANIQRD